MYLSAELKKKTVLFVILVLICVTHCVLKLKVYFFLCLIKKCITRLGNSGVVKIPI